MIALAFIGAMLVAPAMAQLPDRVNVPSIPLQTLYAEDFAEGDGNYTTGGVDSSWEFGEPTSPPEIPEGKNRNVWGTNLDGDYTNRECSYLQSAPIDLSGVPAGNAMLSFKHWIHARMSTFSDTAFDGGIVMVSADGVDWNPIDPVGGYNSDGAGFSLRGCLGIDTDQDVFSSYQSDGPAADEWNTAEFDVSDFLGGDLHVRWVFGSTSSFSAERGWYVDQVAVQHVAGGQNIDLPDLPDPEDIDPNEFLPDRVNVPSIPLQTLYAEDFAEGDGNYTTGGVDSSWEFGEPTSPPEIPEGKNRNVWGTNLDGDYTNRECSYLQSAPIDLSELPAGNAMLSFKHWIHARMSTFSDTAFDGGIVMVSADGVDWTPIDPVGGYNSDGAGFSLRGCLGIDTDQDVFSSYQFDGPAADEWNTAEFDVSDFLGGDLHVRWAFGSTSSFSAERGWYVDQVAVQHVAGGQNIDVPQLPTLGDLTDELNELLPERVNVPIIPLQTLYAEDFAEGDGNYTTGGVDSSWEFGEPTSPPEIPEGKNRNVWGTNLDGDYTNRECSYLQSAPIDLSDVPIGNAVLSFKHWMHARMSSFSGTAFDGGIVLVSADGVDWTPIDPLGDGYNSDGASFSLRGCLGIDTEQDAFSGTDRAADEWDTAEFDVSDFIGGDLHVRWAFGSTSSFSSERGWYVDQVAVQHTLGGQNIAVPQLPDLPDDPTDLIPDLPEFPEEDPETGWGIGGTDVSWEFGNVTDSSSNADLIRGMTGYMTNLDGGHNAPECSFIQSPAVSGTDFVLDPSLNFTHWYRLPGAFVDVAWASAIVMVSGNGGLTWDYLDLPEYDRPYDYTGGNPECFTAHGAPLDGEGFGSAPFEDELKTVNVDLSDYIGSPSVSVRFVFESSSTFSYEGWFIPEVDLGGQRLLG